jgi:protein gp37
VPGLHTLKEPVRENGRVVSWPFGFAPTLHRHRLDEPARVRKPQNVFVSDMGDLFGAWVPGVWINDVLRACAETPRHRYLFLTKNPGRYKEWFLGRGSSTEAHWIGASASTERSFAVALAYLREVHHENRFVSLEPWLEPFELPAGAGDVIRWLIIGGLTGPGARRPDATALARMVDAAQAQGIKVFIKNNAGVVGTLREYPWEDR